MNKNDLDAILEKHRLWLSNDPAGSRADLYGANLSGANLRRADLSGANLFGANLSGANLFGANLRRADLSGANLRSANLSGADLFGANLSGANLRRADLSGADLFGANLRRADLSGANLSGAKNADLVIAMTRILAEGDLIGWKKCNDGVIVKLKIPAKAKRSSAFGRKCRCEYAKVLEVIGAKIGVTNSHGPETKYEKGKTVKCDKWNPDFQVECSGGIHFFITRLEAENF